MDTTDVLDKVFEGELVDLGTITIRVVVLPRLAAVPAEDEELPDVSDNESDADDEEDPSDQKRPIDSYLESSKRGRGVVVFLVNGQRQHQLDSMLIQRDLEFKYLRNRMMVMVDVDGLSQWALSKLMNGARQSFYQGEVYDALIRRVIRTLKADPDLVRLEEAAKQAASSLRTGDKVVKDALDKLIHAHSPRGKKGAGMRLPGESNRGPDGGRLQQSIEVVAEGYAGERAEGPALRLTPETSHIRVFPDEECRLLYVLHPPSDHRIVSFHMDTTPPVPGLEVRHEEQNGDRAVVLQYPTPADESEPEYPIRRVLTATALVNGNETPRILSTRVTIGPRPDSKPREPRPAPILIDEPTVLRLVTRQPVTMIVGGSDIHLKFKWDGKDQLLNGPGATWTRRLLSTTMGERPVAVAFTQATEGRFEAVLPVPDGAAPGATLTWRVELAGPGGLTLAASFSTVVIEPLAPRQVTAQVQGGREDQEDYEIVYIERDKWTTVQCFDKDSWTGTDSGAFEEPTGERPLTLYINIDYEPLLEFLQDMTDRKLAETTIELRKNKYTTHLAYHLYQMFSSTRQKSPAATPSESSDEARMPDEAMRREIERVATTMLQLMERGS